MIPFVRSAVISHNAADKAYALHGLRDLADVKVTTVALGVKNGAFVIVETKQGNLFTVPLSLVRLTERT